MLETRVRLRTADLTWRVVDGTVIALNLESSTYLTTNRTGAILWDALAQGTTVGELVERLREEFGVSDSVATSDVRDFLRLMEANALLLFDS